MNPNLRTPDVELQGTRMLSRALQTWPSISPKIPLAVEKSVHHRGSQEFSSTWNPHKQCTSESRCILEVPQRASQVGQLTSEGKLPKLSPVSSCETQTS